MFKISEANALEEYSPSNQQYHKNDVNFKQSNVSQIQLEFVHKNIGLLNCFAVTEILIWTFLELYKSQPLSKRLLFNPIHNYNI